jgi:hypothetical protein
MEDKKDEKKGVMEKEDKRRFLPDTSRLDGVWR